MKTIYILLGILIFLVAVLLAGVAANIVVTMEMQQRLKSSSPLPASEQWNEDEWARKAIALDGHNEIAVDQLTFYTLLMEEASQHCVENKEVLDRLIEAALFQSPKELPNIRRGILSVYAGLSGRHNCSEMLFDIINELNE